MPRSLPIWRYALLFFTFLSITLAASPTSFCKCTCFTNSTIIPLDDSTTALKSNTFFTSAANDTEEAPSEPSPEKPKTGRTCNDCNKSFCLSYNLAICKDAEEKDVFTTCFQRDSTKDQVVIYLFILATMGLLGWAAVKPWWEKWRARQYAPVRSGNGQ